VLVLVLGSVLVLVLVRVLVLVLDASGRVCRKIQPVGISPRN
jgi:hypothetical protein